MHGHTLFFIHSDGDNRLGLSTANIEAIVREYNQAEGKPPPQLPHPHYFQADFHFKNFILKICLYKYSRNPSVEILIEVL